MSTKYSVSATSRWKMQTGVRLTDHAAKRWDQRTPSGSVSPEFAYEHGEDVDEILPCINRQSRDDDFESVRAYRCAGDEIAVFLVRNNAIITVYQLDDVRDRAARGFIVSRAVYGRTA